MGDSDRRKRWMFLAHSLLRHVDAADLVERQALRDDYRSEYHHRLRPDKVASPQMGEHARGDLQQLLSALRGSRHTTQASHTSSDLLSHDLAQFEKIGVLSRRGESVAIRDWVTLAAISDGHFDPEALFANVRSGE